MKSPRIQRIALVTDFGSGLYLGQVMLRLDALVPGMPTVDLVSNLAPFRPDLAAYLLPALVRDLPPETLFLCVVDPGVGGERGALALAADGNWFVGPDNGLLGPVARRAGELRVERVRWRPSWSSDSFHGRDLFAPIAARLSLGEPLEAEVMEPATLAGWEWPADLAKVVHVDRYGNLLTGWRAGWVDRRARVRVGGQDLPYARTFCEVPPGAGFWYEDAFGLVEVAVNRGRADRVFGLGPGDDLGPPSL
jgi:S-adenosyl-L-methionine hydrolase (adenosine-forming)